MKEKRLMNNRKIIIAAAMNAFKDMGLILGAILLSMIVVGGPILALFLLIR